MDLTTLELPVHDCYPQLSDLNRITMRSKLLSRTTGHFVPELQNGKIRPKFVKSYSADPLRKIAEPPGFPKFFVRHA